eukprot:scaffold95474_cov27-Phaeocystis_antarctica.AAC.1
MKGPLPGSLYPPSTAATIAACGARVTTRHRHTNHRMPQPYAHQPAARFTTQTCNPAHPSLSLHP